MGSSSRRSGVLIRAVLAGNPTALARCYRLISVNLNSVDAEFRSSRATTSVRSLKGHLCPRNQIVL